MIYIQIINSTPSFLLRATGEKLSITPLVDGVPGDAYSDRQHTIGGSEINDSHFAAGSAASERAALGIYPITTAAGFDSDRYSSTGKTYTFNGSNGIEAHTLVEHPLETLQQRKVNQLKGEFVRRVQIQNPSLNSLDDVAWAREQWLSIAPAARQATVGFQNAIDNYAAGVAAIGVIDAYVEGQEQLVIDYDVVNTPAWPT